MADQQANINSILAALTAQRPGTGTPNQHGISTPQPGLQQGYPGIIPSSTPPTSLSNFALPQPTSSGSLDLTNIKPVNSGSVSIADAIAKARGIAAEKGLSFENRSGSCATTFTNDHFARMLNNFPVSIHDNDPRLTGRSYRRSDSRSRSPPPGRIRDNYNPYRDERREDRGRRDYGRERSYSPGPRGRAGDAFSPPPSRGYGSRSDRSPGRGGDSDNVETITIDSSLVGLIIGRQGENLRRVETESGTRVQFITGPDATGPTRQCKITGSRSARADAKSKIYRIIDENGSSGKVDPAQFDHPRPSATPVRNAGAHQPALREGEDSMQIMVPDRTVGLIIGRGGETIRDLQERSGCHVNITGESKSVNGLRPVNLIGSHQSAMKAKDLIMEIVESDTKSMTNGPQKETPREVASAGPDKINDSVRVPSEAVGMIIGKGGETIRDIQNSSGCKINVSPASGQDIEREIGLIGSRNAIELAKKAIWEKVDAVQQKNRGNAPGGAGSRQQQDAYNDAYSQPQSYDQRGPAQSQPGNAAPAQGTDPSDPYAPYGGYANYVAMWYAAMAQQQQQQQQQGQSQGEQPKPPGTA